MCNLYSITRSQEAKRRLFRIKRDLTGNFPGLPAIYADTMASVVRTASDGERDFAAKPRRRSSTSATLSRPTGAACLNLNGAAAYPFRAAHGPARPRRRSNMWSSSSARTGASITFSPPTPRARASTCGTFFPKESSQPKNPVDARSSRLARAIRHQQVWQSARVKISMETE
jgi:hypothetical protein